MSELEEDYFAAKWIAFECKVEQNPTMFAFGVTATCVLLAILVGSILGYNKKTSGRFCCKLCRCGGPGCTYCCIPFCKCPAKCVSCKCCYDDDEGGTDHDDEDYSGVTPGGGSVQMVQRFDTTKNVIREKKATAAITKQVSQSMFDFENFLEERAGLSDEEDEAALHGKIEQDYDNEGENKRNAEAEDGAAMQV